MKGISSQRDLFVYNLRKIVYCFDFIYSLDFIKSKVYWELR